MKTPKEFYTELEAEGLAKRKNKIHTKKELSYLNKLLRKDQKILDLACGYGRFTIPLAKFGYDIEGIDITPALIKKAKEDAKKEGVEIKFMVGDMRKLPYRANNFNVIICMWSAFPELTKKSDQLKAIKEMSRVLKKGGFVLIDLPELEKMKKNIVDIKKGDYFKKSKNGNITYAVISGIEAMHLYRHNNIGTIKKRFLI